jgi:hypothetical protein
VGGSIDRRLIGMSFEERFELASLFYFVGRWLDGDYDDGGCCLGCVVTVLAGLVGVALVVGWLW